MENNYTNKQADISHIPDGMEQMIEHTKNMTPSERDKELKSITQAQMAIENIIRQERKKKGWDGEPIGRQIAQVGRMLGDASLQRLREAKTEDEYLEARSEIINQNKLQDGGYNPDVPYTLPVTEWRALCALCSDETWVEYGYQFSENLFTDPERRTVYNTIKAIAEEGRSLDIMLIFEKLRYTVSTEWLTYLASETINTYQLPYWLQELKVMAKKREYDNTFKASAMLLADNSISTDTINERLRQVMEDSPVEEVATLGDALNEVLEQMKRNREGTTVGTYTGFTEIDVVGGFQGGDFIVLAGDTSSGKTSFALSITLNAMRERNVIAYYSLEMPKKRLGARLVSMYEGTDVSSSRILRNGLYDAEEQRVKDTIAIMPQTELLFDDKATIKFDDLLGSIRMMAKKYNIKGAIIDYLQILNVTNNRGKDTQEQMMAQVARRLKNVAMECNIWVMALSQLNRDKNSAEPTLARLRDSGQIAEAADIVMLIYRPEIYGLPYSGTFSNKSTNETAQIDIAKGRDIGTKKFLVGFNPKCTYFYSVRKEDVPDVVATSTSTSTQTEEFVQPEYPTQNDLPF
ncbi:MAG: DnaB-like helicase C-terminal domain-containing protein [Coprobacillus sp.]|nr:DnaB-like helicase C-terminal domain-containing protein [Coprobacillus sp.]